MELSRDKEGVAGHFHDFHQIAIRAGAGDAETGGFHPFAVFVIEFVAVPSLMSLHKEVAREFVRFCAGPGKPLLVANGIS